MSPPRTGSTILKAGATPDQIQAALDDPAIEIVYLEPGKYTGHVVTNVHVPEGKRLIGLDAK